MAVTEEQKQKARQEILAKVNSATDDEEKIDIAIGYFKEGHAIGMKAGIRQTMQMIKQQIDGIVEQMNKPNEGGGNG